MTYPNPRAKADWQTWAFELVNILNQPKPLQAPQIPVFSIATLPRAATVGLLIFVSDSIDGLVLAYSDGTNWRSVMDQEIIE